MKLTLTLAAAGLMTMGFADMGEANQKTKYLDRLEDRIDRRESIRDERVDHGRRDVIEDRVDRWESRRDRAGKPTPRFINAWERRSWKKRWGRN